MKKIYINSTGSLSAQKTFENTSFLNEVVDYTNTIIPIIDPNYKDYIPPAAARRMAKGIKMGVVASKIALQEAQLENIDAIITGTGMGCLRDSEKFLSTILDNDEQYLTPTPFIQSTHNTVAGQIALELQCKGYNFTYVHGSVSFESALIDAKLQLEQDEAENILVGGIDEIGDYTASLHLAINHIKSELTNSLTLLSSKTKGSILSEGANFFVLAHKKQVASYAELVGVKIYNTLTQNAIAKVAEDFLEENQLSTDAIDLLILGNNGDAEFDGLYQELATKSFKNTQQVGYKHICGEFNTASSFGFWLGAKILKTQTLPDVVKLNNIPTASFKTILLYNQYRGENHSFTLLRQC